MQRLAFGFLLLAALAACNDKPAKDSGAEATPTTTASVAPTPTASTPPSTSSSKSATPVSCGSATCPAGQICCNASCGICAPPGSACIQMACNGSNGSSGDVPVEPPDAGKATSLGTGPNPIGAKCKLDSECDLFSSYCPDAPCQCFAIGKAMGAPKCKTDRPLNCLVDPCQSKTAKCRDGHCATVAK